jgi:hypothetical protein
MRVRPDEAPTIRPRLGRHDEIGEIRRLYCAGKIEEALALADRVRARDRLPLSAIPVVTVTREALLKLPLDHRAGFMLTRIDGISTLQGIIDVSAMPQDEALVIIEKLLTVGALALATDEDEPTAPGLESSDDNPTLPVEPARK